MGGCVQVYFPHFPSLVLDQSWTECTVLCPTLGQEGPTNQCNMRIVENRFDKRFQSISIQSISIQYISIQSIRKPKESEALQPHKYWKIWFFKIIEEGIGYNMIVVETRQAFRRFGYLLDLGGEQIYCQEHQLHKSFTLALTHRLAGSMKEFWRYSFVTFVKH